MIERSCTHCYLEKEFSRPHLFTNDRPLVFIEGAQGAGKSTLAEILAEKSGIAQERGFLSSQDFAKYNSQAEICRAAIELVSRSPECVGIFDRSPLSHFAFLHTYDSSQREKYLLCAERLLAMLGSNNIAIIHLDIAPTTSVLRQDPTTLFNSASLSIAAMEIESYGKMMAHLKNGTNQHHVIPLTNNPGEHLDEIVNYALQQLSTIKPI